MRGKDFFQNQQKDQMQAFLEKDTHASAKNMNYKSATAKLKINFIFKAKNSILAVHPQKATCFDQG